MRTINELQLNRLLAEAEEADTIGLNKVAEHLTNQIEKNTVRSNNENYTYASSDFENDVHGILWDAVVRTADIRRWNFCYNVIRK